MTVWGASDWRYPANMVTLPPMNKNKMLWGLALLPLLAALAACAGKSVQVGPWGYTFVLGSFSDQRPKDNDMLMAKTPFRIDDFMRHWDAIVTRDVFYQHPAKLDVILKRYAASQARINYALSMDVTLRARDADGLVLATMDGRCSSVATPGLTQIGDFAQQVATKGDASLLTKDARAANMWQRVLHACIEDLATQFGQALAQGQPSAAR